MALPELKSNILPDNEIITTHTQDGAEVISQLQGTDNSVESYVSAGNPVYTTHNVVPQVLTVLKENGQDITTVVDGFWDVVWSVNGQTGDVTIDAVAGNFIPNHTYRQNSIIMHEGHMYRAVADFTTGAEFDLAGWSEIAPQAAIVFNLFQPNHHYYSRQPIWQDGSIYVANAEFVSGETFSPADWTKASGGGAWGEIEGDIEDQTDLQQALDAKQDELTAGSRITITNNVISADDQFFRCVFGSTTYQEVSEAVVAGKIPIVQTNTDTVYYCKTQNDTHYFFDFVNTSTFTITLDSTNSWGYSQKTLEDSSNKVTSWSATATDSYYPSEKLVKTALDSHSNSISSISSKITSQASAANQLIDKNYVDTNLANITVKIPEQATASNQLADKNFVNSTVQTGTANFRGNWETWSDVPANSALYPADYGGAHTPTVNDYLVVRDASDYEGGQRILPTEYTQLDYIENNGTQYVNTGITPSQVDTVDMYLSISDTSKTSQYFAGTRSSGTAIGYALYFTAHGGLNYYPLAWGNNGYATTQGTKIHFTTIMSSGNSSCEIDDKSTLSKTYNQNTYEGGADIYIGAIRETSGSANYGSYAKFYEIIFSKDGEEVAHYIPAKDSSDQIGFFDLVSQTFIAGTGTFIAGPEVTPEDLEGTWRFKYSGVWETVGKGGWRPEYQVNETPMTAAQLAALNSGITSQTWAQAQTDIGNKVDKVTGKGLSTNDYTTAEKNKLAGLPDAISSGAYYATCSTASATQTKVATTAERNFVLKTGAQAVILMSSNNTYNGKAKLDIDNTGAKELLPYVGASTTRYFWRANEVISVVYDGTCYVMIDGHSADVNSYGVTKLSTATDSTATDLSATPSAVKTAYDLADSKAKINVTDTDPGEGSVLPANNFIAVTGDEQVQTADIANAAVTASKIDFTTLNFGNYSTDEQDTGFTWIDGNKIYKKTFSLGSINAGENNKTISLPNLSKRIKIEMVSTDTGFGNCSVAKSSGTATSWNSMSLWNVTSTSATVFSTISVSNVYLTVYYTKS